MPKITRVRVSDELIDLEPQLQNMDGAGRMQAGVWHGSLWIDGIHSTNDHRDNTVRCGPHNADRCGRLALLMAWSGSGDRQFVYEDDPPHLMHVVDMGHALPGANNWTVANLDAHAPSATLMDDLWTGSGYQRGDAERVLNEIGDPVQMIAHAVARPLDHWGPITMDDRISFAHYLSRQYDALRQKVATL